MGTAEALGSATGAIIAGVLVDRVPLRPLLNAQAAIYITAGVLAGALIARHRAEYPPESAVTPSALPPMAAPAPRRSRSRRSNQRRHRMRPVS
jgi:hypothetical protein